MLLQEYTKSDLETNAAHYQSVKGVAHMRT